MNRFKSPRINGAGSFLIAIMKKAQACATFSRFVPAGPLCQHTLFSTLFIDRFSSKKFGSGRNGNGFYWVGLFFEVGDLETSELTFTWNLVEGDC